MPEPHTSRQVAPCPCPFTGWLQPETNRTYTSAHTLPVCAGGLWAIVPLVTVRPYAKLRLRWKGKVTTQRPEAGRRDLHSFSRLQQGFSFIFIHFIASFTGCLGGILLTFIVSNRSTNLVLIYFLVQEYLQKKYFKIGLDQIILHKSFSTSCS